MERADAVVVRSINDLTERHGFGPKASAQPPHFQSLAMEQEPLGLWVADDAGEIIGFGFSWVCGDFWYLSQLFVAPGRQGEGIGAALIDRTLRHAELAAATNKALITFAFNRESQGLYLRHALYPRFPIYDVCVPREQLVGRLQGPHLRSAPLEDGPSHTRVLARIDDAVLGFSRERHHRYLINHGAMRGVVLYADEECVGYAYVSHQGHIGPLAVARPEAMEAAFRTALALAIESGSAQVSAFLPGPCEPALAVAVAHGMHITFPMVLMSASPFGDWTCYLPRNPVVM